MSNLTNIVAGAALAGSLMSGVVAQDEDIAHVEDVTTPAETVYGSGEKQQESSDALRFEKADSESELPFSVFMSTEVKSKYRVDGGFTLSEGAVNQSIFDLSFADVLGEGTTVGAYVWKNFDFNTRGISELDVAGYVSFPIAERFMGGKLTGDLELALWDFDNFADGSIAPNQAVALMGRLNYSGPVDLTFELTQTLSDGQGREYDLIASKSFDIGRIGKDIDLTFTPQISASYLENFFGVDGFSNIQYGASLSATRGNVSLEGYLEQQEGFLDGFESGLVGGVKLSFGF